jgi:hypothetical protein
MVTTGGPLASGNNQFSKVREDPVRLRPAGESEEKSENGRFERSSRRSLLHTQPAQLLKKWEEWWQPELFH